jgi:hypothetical protein
MRTQALAGISPVVAFVGAVKVIISVVLFTLTPQVPDPAVAARVLLVPKETPAQLV